MQKDYFSTLTQQLDGVVEGPVVLERTHLHPLAWL